jgi:hypothetical protein
VKLMNEMNLFYGEISKPVNEVIVDKIYALTIEDLTYRVRARSVNNRIVSHLYFFFFFYIMVIVFI